MRSEQNITVALATLIARESKHRGQSSGGWSQRHGMNVPHERTTQSIVNLLANNARLSQNRARCHRVPTAVLLTATKGGNNTYYTPLPR